MLYYNFQPLFQARGIRNPATLLVKSGITYNIANRIASGQLDKISLKTMEKVCRVINCTPSDIYTFKPDNEQDKSELNALSKLIRDPEKMQALQNLVRTIPIEKLAEIADLLNQKK